MPATKVGKIDKKALREDIARRLIVVYLTNSPGTTASSASTGAATGHPGTSPFVTTGFTPRI